MATPLHSTGSSCLHTRNSTKTQSSFNSRTKVSSSLKLPPSSFLGHRKPSLTAQFHSAVYKSLTSRTSKNPTLMRVSMMPIGTPRVPYKTPGEGTYQWVDVWNALCRERIICIGKDYIDEEYSNQILATILYLDNVDSGKNLLLLINSQGGDITPCMSLYDTIRSTKSPISTTCMGQAYNMAAHILAGGDKGKRAAMPLSSISLESPTGAARGQADDIQIEASELLRVRNYLFRELAKNTGQPVEKIHKDLSTRKYFGAKEAKEYGLIDRVIKKDKYTEDEVEGENKGGIGWN